MTKKKYVPEAPFFGGESDGKPFKMPGLTAAETATKARSAVATLINARDQLGEQWEKVDAELDKAMVAAYKAGVSAIELSKLTGLTRPTIYDRLKRSGLFERQRPTRAKRNPKSGRGRGLAA